jgi:4-amino-4-deoxy-L-arabinose transferase-like glycosyltransferase
VPIAGRRLALAALLLLNVLVYSAWLGYSPIYMHDAEVLFALHARSIAATLRDTNGTFLPLYFHMPSIGANVWFHPLIVYLTALFLKVLPFAEWSVRLPSVAVGTVDVALVYLIGCRLFRDRAYGVLAAAFLALTPAHFIHSRLEMDYIYPLPFVLLWLWCLLKFDDTADKRLMWMGGFALGVGFYSYIAAVAFMPLYLLFTWLYLFAKYRRLRLIHLTTTVAFVIPLLLFVAWRVIYPDIFSGTAYRYAITRNGVALGILRLFNYNLIGDYVSNYWNFYNPNFLFLVGSPNFQSSTRAAGVFLIPLALFLTVGVYEVATREKPRVGWLLIAGFLTAPLPAVLVEEPYAIYREMEMLPFAVLIAVFGARRLLTADPKWLRGLAVAAIVAMPLQFTYFVSDYFTAYRLNSFNWFGGNIRGAAEKVLELNAVRPVPAVYLSQKIPYGVERWHFYMAKAGSEDVFARTRVLGPDTPLTTLPSGSLVLVQVVDREVQDPRVAPPEVRKVADIIEPFGQRPIAFELFERP